MTTLSMPFPQRSKPLLQVIAALMGGILLFLIFVTALTVIFQGVYAGRIFPGVRVGGVDLSGLPPLEAATKLSQALPYPYTGQIAFRYGDRVWVATPSELGLVFDVGSSIQTAYNVGRNGGLFGRLAGQVQTLQSGMDIPPVVVLDQRVAYDYLQKIAAQIDQPVIEANLVINGVEVAYTPGQIGRILNIDDTLVILASQLQSFRDGEVPLVLHEQAPEILDASAQAEVLRQMLSAPMVLSVPNPVAGDPAPWVVEPPMLAGMVSINRVPAAEGVQYQLSLNPQGLQPLLAQLASQLDHGQENARFIFNDDTKQLDLIQPAVIGRSLDIAATLNSIQQKLLAGQHDIPLEMVYQQPAVGDDATAASLGITELVSMQMTYFRGSGGQRIQNIQTAAARFHGLLIAPGETFSMGQALGDISLENGYAEAMIIYNGRTIKGVGGGVCQVSTSLFRTVFFGGFPIVERHAHAYRVSYYEQNASSTDNTLAGLDATVYFPLVDFKFTNDTSTWLLMETYVNVGLRRLTWKFYSTSDGRTVEWNTSGVQAVVPAPEPLFQENPDLQTDEMKQTDWAADGADIVVIRTVMRGGAVLFSDSIRTHYLPWQAVCEYGPGTDTENLQGMANDLGLCQRP